jgi:CRISPR-associated protein Cas1
MSIVYLTTMGSSVRRRGERLQVFKDDAKLADLRLFELERLVVFGAVQFTAQALALLLDKGIDVAFLTSRGRLRGSLVAGQSRNVYLRLAQFERWKDDAFRLAFSRNLVVAKLTAQERLLARYERNHPDRLDANARDRIRSVLEKTASATTLDELRGFEGAGAAAYYGQFGRMLTSMDFPGRKKHPSTDPVNALLSLGYVLLTNEIAALLEARGFDPAVGFFHGIRYGRQSLSLDVVEPFRQPVIDRLTLRLLNRGQITAAEFEGGEKGLRLVPDSFRRYLLLYEEQMSAPSEGEGTPTWREQLRQQSDALREMIMDATPAMLYTWTGRRSS